MSGLDFKPYERYVQSGMVDGQFSSAAFTLFCVGPPRLANIGSSAALAVSKGKNIVQPVGVMQQWSLGQNIQFSRIFELGSERSYFIRGRTMGQLSLGRVYYHGPSLLRMMYAYYSDIIPPTLIAPFYDNVGSINPPNKHDVKVSPGYSNLYLNMASDLFSQPVGGMVKMMDSNEDTLGGMYFEACYIPNHNIGTDSMGTVLQESCSIQYERTVPVALSSLALVEDIGASIL